MGKGEDNTADATKCAGCGEAFVPGSGPYMRTGFHGLYHKRCLPHGPAPDQYRAGLIAGLREAAGLVGGFPVNDDDPHAFAKRKRDMELAKAIRARITALEEEGKS